MIDILIFSRDRACQLELLLRSLKENFHEDYSITVLYKATSHVYETAYQKLPLMYNVKLFPETNFKTDTGIIVSQHTNRFTMFLCDDDVIINEVNVKELNTLIDRYNRLPIHTISLRMNETINYCYPARKEIQPPAFIEKTHDYLLWDWTKCNTHYCWGYPTSLDGHLYETKKILPILQLPYPFKNPNDLESHLNRNRNHNLPLLISPKQSKVFNIQNNFVKAVVTQKFETNTYTVEDLNRLFLEGFIIDTKNIYGINLPQAHGPIVFTFIKKQAHQ